MKNILEIRDLHVEVQGEEILHGVNLSIPEGEVHALLGPNGSGKTSIMMSVMGFSSYKITRGEILFKGEVINEMDITQRAQLGIGIAQQRPPTIQGVKLHQILDYTARKSPLGKLEINSLVKMARTENFLERDINAGLSGGEIKRSELVQLLATRPGFAMMDEPESGVDVEAMELIGSMTNDLFTKDPQLGIQRTSGLIITHSGSILKYIDADKAHVMINGRVKCSGDPMSIFNVACESGYESCATCLRREKGVVVYE